MGTGNDETFNISSLRLIQYDVAEDLKYVPNIIIPGVIILYIGNISSMFAAEFSQNCF